MGCMVKLSFVARNTVPCTTNRPLRIVPSYVINSTMTNTLSTLFNYGLVTPRNNVFMFTAVRNA